MVSSEQLRNSTNPQEVLEQRLPAAPAGETAGSVLAAQAVAVIQARTAMAVARPRDLDVVRQNILKECRRPGFADAAIYHKPIGDGVEGLSIRFVEAALRCMRNVSTDVQVIYDDDQKRILRVVVSDLENNVSYTGDITIAKTIERSRHNEYDTVLRKRLNSKGKAVFLLQADDEQILDKVNALTSKAMRTLGLRVIPGDIADEAEQLCYKIRNDKAAKDPDGERLRIIDGFGSLGVAVDQLKAYLGHDGSTLTPKELSTLRGLYVALRDEETTWREVMESRASPKQTDQKDKDGWKAGENAGKPTPIAEGSPAAKAQQERNKPKESELAQGRAALGEGPNQERVEADRRAAEAVQKRQADPPAKLDDEFDIKSEDRRDPADPEPQTEPGAITYLEIVGKIAAKDVTIETLETVIVPMIEFIGSDQQKQALHNMAKGKIAGLKRAKQQSQSIE